MWYLLSRPKIGERKFWAFGWTLIAATIVAVVAIRDGESATGTAALIAAVSGVASGVHAWGNREEHKLRGRREPGAEEDGR